MRRARAAGLSFTVGRGALLAAASGALAMACGGVQAGPPGVAHYDRPPGLPIGTGASGGELEEPAVSSGDAELVIPRYEPGAAPEPAPPPCSGCVELGVYVNDINQRDEFSFAAGDVAITRVIWTILVTFNSDQLAVQPFVDDVYGKYTNLHVNTFPLGTAVRVEQEVARTARVIGLVLGSSGAWTGDQTIGVFVDSVSVEGPHPFTKSFDAGAEGLAPRTDRRQPKVVHYPAP
jgi:hypothetical protein